MIHAILITGGSSQSREEKALQIAEALLGQKTTYHPDFFFVKADDSIKINQVRELQKWLQFKPYAADKKLVLIQDANLLTLPAQHSLLKTLEEPPPASVIILATQSKELLLPTLISRCQMMPLSDKPPITNNQQAITQEIIRSSPGKRLLFAENQAQSREKSQEFCQQQLVFWRCLLREETPFLPPLQTCRTIRQISQTLLFLKANVNPRLALENLLLSYPK